MTSTKHDHSHGLVRRPRSFVARTLLAVTIAAGSNFSLPWAAAAVEEPELCPALKHLVRSATIDFAEYLTPAGQTRAGKPVPVLPGAIEAEFSGTSYKATFLLVNPQSAAEAAPISKAFAGLQSHVEKCYPGVKGDPFRGLRQDGLFYRLKRGIVLTVEVGPHYRREGGRDGSEVILGVSKGAGYF